MAPMIPAALIGKLTGSGGSATKSVLTGDMAIIRYTKKGKGKGRKKKPDKDIELHVNPVSITAGLGIGVVAIGAAATLAAIALWMAGMGLKRNDTATKIYTVRNTGTADKPSWYLYSQRGILIRKFGESFTNDDILSATKLGQGWTIDSTTKSKDGTWYGIVAKNAGKKHWSMEQRSRFGIKIGGGPIF